MRYFSLCLAVPMRLNGDRGSAEDGDGGEICPVKIYENGAGNT